MIEHISGFYYVGQSLSIYDRISSHITDLYMNKHSSTDFQALFNRTNIEEWSFKVIKKISKTELKSEWKIKGKEFDKKFKQFLLKVEKEEMGKLDVKYALNKQNRYFKNNI